MTTRFQKLHITSRLISAYLLQSSQIPINTLFCQFNSLFANTEMYEAINKLRNYRIICANFIHEYRVNFHERYIPWLYAEFFTVYQSILSWVSSLHKGSMGGSKTQIYLKTHFIAENAYKHILKIWKKNIIILALNSITQKSTQFVK